MSTVIRAAVVETLGQPPKCMQMNLGAPAAGQVTVKVVASGVHRLVKSRASARHYSSGTELPMVVGVDGCGYLESGQPVYYVSLFDKKCKGAMASVVHIDEKACIPVPASGDLKLVAALVNPTISSWLALRFRAQTKPGFRALILGATGSSGQLAIQVARELGASHVVGIARNAQVLSSLVKPQELLDDSIVLPTSSDQENDFIQQVAQKTSDIDVVLDYLGGRPAELCIPSMVTARQNKQQRLDWVQIGSLAGPDLVVPTAALRSANFYVSGSGLGSVSASEMLNVAGEVVNHLATGKLKYAVAEADVSRVEEVWDKATDGRLVLTFQE